MFGPVGREIMSAGTIIFAIAATVGCSFLCGPAYLRLTQGICREAVF
jgi:hypothetical protein